MSEEKEVKIKQSTQFFIELDFGSLLTSERAILKALMEEDVALLKMFSGPAPISIQQKEIEEDQMVHTVCTLTFTSPVSEEEAEATLAYLKAELARLSQLDSDLGILAAAESEWDVPRPSKKKRK